MFDMIGAIQKSDLNLNLSYFKGPVNNYWYTLSENEKNRRKKSVDTVSKKSKKVNTPYVLK